jgi:hypothetical protein
MPTYTRSASPEWDAVIFFTASFKGSHGNTVWFCRTRSAFPFPALSPNGDNAVSQFGFG